MPYDYDKENIEKADKAGVFIDSPIDAQVLETEASERNRMKKELEGMSDKERERAKELPFSPTRSSKKDLKRRAENLKKKVKLNIWERIVYWFKGIFGGALSQYRFLTKKEIKRAKAVIMNHSPLFYDFKDPSTVKPRITRDFAETIYKIYAPLQKLKYLFQDALISEDMVDATEESFFFEFESELVGEDAKRILERLSKRRIYELFDHHDNAVVTIEKELYNFRNEVENSDYRNIETYSDPFEGLLLLRKVDFKTLFQLFDKDFVDSNKYKPQLRNNIYVNELRESGFLKDFDIYLKAVSRVNMPENVALHFDSVMRKILMEEKYEIEEETPEEEEEEEEEVSVLLETEEEEEAPAAPQKEKEEEQEEKKKESKYMDLNIDSRRIKELIKDIKALNKSEVIPAMIKYIYKDANYETRKIPVPSSFFEKYLLNFSSKIKAISDICEKEIKDKHLKDNISSLFNVEDDNDVNIMYVENYTPQINKKLEEKKLRQFDHVKAIALIRMFFEKHYFKYMREPIDKLVVEGEFSDKQVGQEFSNNIYNLEDDYNSLKEFRSMMRDSDSVKTLIRGINVSGSLDPSQKNVLVNKITEINTKAKTILESALPKLLDIQLIISHIMEDSKSKNPTFVYNIKTISGLANRTYLNKLNNVGKKIKQFLKIMKNFHLVVSSSYNKK